MSLNVPARFICCRSYILGLLLLSVAFTPLTAVEIELLDGKKIEGTELHLDSDNLRINNQDAITLNDVDRIVLNPEQAVLPAHHRGLLLKDGSWLPYTEIHPISDGVRATTPLGSLSIPLGSVVAWGDPQWIDSQREQRHDLVFLQSDSTISGTILGIHDEQLRIRSELADEPLTFPLAEVAGMHLALPTDRPRGLHFTTSLAVGRPQARMVANDGKLYLQAHPKQEVAIDAVGQLQVHGGRRVFLSDLTPNTVEEEGAFGTIWNYAVNSNIDGSPLILGGTYYAHGLVLHSRARLSWELEGHYQRFHSFLGISDVMLPHNVGDCEVSILVDGERRWHQSSVRVGEAPQRVELDLTDAQTLTIIVDYGARFDIGDHLALAGAWLLRRE